MTHLIRAESLQGFSELVKSLDGDVAGLLKKQGLSTKLLRGQGQFLSYRRYIQLLEDCSKVLHCDDFGIELAAKQSIDILGPLAIVAKQATTLEEALSCLVKYIHFHTPGLMIGLTNLPNDNESLMSFSIVLPEVAEAKQTYELTLALASQVVAQLSNQRLSFIGLYLPYEKEQLSWHFRQVFKCSLRDEYHIAGLVVRTSDLSMPVMIERQDLSNAASLYLLRHCGEKELNLLNHVVVLIKAMLAFDCCDNQTVAFALGMNVRQLHRKLTQQQTSFVKIKNQTRRELACHYLAQPSISMIRITALLGYQEQSALTKACHQWFDCGARAARHNITHGKTL